MNKPKIIAELDRLVGEMEPFFRYLKRGTVDAFKVDLSVQDYRALRALHLWVATLHRIEFEALKKAWELVPPAMWEGYRAHKVKGLQEQLILADAVSKWKQTWGERYAELDAKIPEHVPDQGDGHVIQNSE